MNESYGLDQPLYVQYKDYLVNVAKWDFGPSFKQKGQSVNKIINRSFPYSLILGLEAIFLALSVGVFLGVFAALYHNKFGDYAAMIFAVLGISVPSFILATILQYIFTFQLYMLLVNIFDRFTDYILSALYVVVTSLT